MAGTDWVAIGGIAQLLAAAATATLALFTWRMAAKTKALASESGREASATETLATEALEDRRLAWRPHLGLNAISYTFSRGRWHLQVVNIGSGPAVAATCLVRTVRDIRQWGLIVLGAMGPGKEFPVHAEIRGGPGPTSPFDVDGVRPPGAVVAVLSCEDVLGRRFRFPVVDQGFTGGREDLPLPPEISDSEPRPAWALEPLIWG